MKLLWPTKQKHWQLRRIFRNPVPLVYVNSHSQLKSLQGSLEFSKKHRKYEQSIPEMKCFICVSLLWIVSPHQLMIELSREIENVAVVSCNISGMFFRLHLTNSQWHLGVHDLTWFGFPWFPEDNKSFPEITALLDN